VKKIQGVTVIIAQQQAGQSGRQDNEECVHRVLPIVFFVHCRPFDRQRIHHLSRLPTFSAYDLIVLQLAQNQNDQQSLVDLPAQPTTSRDICIDKRV